MRPLPAPQRLSKGVGWIRVGTRAFGGVAASGVKVGGRFWPTASPIRTNARTTRYPYAGRPRSRGYNEGCPMCGPLLSPHNLPGTESPDPAAMTPGPAPALSILVSARRLCHRT